MAFYNSRRAARASHFGVYIFRPQGDPRVDALARNKINHINPGREAGIYTEKFVRIYVGVTRALSCSATV